MTNNDGKPIALITGASAGIGCAFAHELSRRGYDLVLVARDEARLESLGKELGEARGTNVEVLAADLTVARDVTRVEKRLRDTASPIDVLINNAGFGTHGKFHELPIAAETRMIALNVTALTRLTHAALGPMVQRGHGGILNVSSIGGFQPSPEVSTYAATKAFVMSFTQGVHEEVRPLGVRVTALAPGATRTEFQARAGIDDGGALPAFVWQTAEEVAVAGLDALEHGRAVCVPGALNKAMGYASSVMPPYLSRKTAKLVARYYEPQ